MKRFPLILVAFFTVVLSVNAQDISTNTIGLRLGDSDGFGAEISYQRAILENNRIEFNLGWRHGDNYTAGKVTGLYQWVWNFYENFNWYAGGGGGFASYKIDDLPPGVDDTKNTLILAGNVGIEYDFDIPLILSLDFRPELGFGDFNDDLDFDIGLGLRYQF